MRSKRTPKCSKSYNKVHIQPGTLTSEMAAYLGVVQHRHVARAQFIRLAKSNTRTLDGTMKYFVPEKDVLIAASGVQNVMAYAGIAQASDMG